MKKLLAILMTVAMIVGVFTFGVSAAECSDCQSTNTDQFDHIVGVGGKKHASDGKGVGVDANNFNDTSSTGTVVLNLTSVASRYAVDIEFQTLTFSYGGSNIWSVNNYKYEFDDNAPNPEVKTLVTITNHSDKQVAVTVTPTVSSFLNSVAKFSITDVTTDAYIVKPTISGHIYTSILMGVPETAVKVEDYVAVQDNLEVTFEPLVTTTWANVLTAMEGHIVDNKVTLGQIVVTVSKNIPTSVSN